MRISERLIARLILFTPLLTVFLVIAVATYLYVKRIRDTYQDEQQRYLKEYLATQQLQSENWVKQTLQLFEYGEAQLEANVKKRLKDRVDLAFDTATYIQEKYQNLSHEVVIKRHISDSLKRMVWEGTQRNYIWITDYRGNNILSTDKSLQNGNLIDYLDADGRAIVLEQIQLVRKYGEGYLKTRYREGGGDQIMYVRDFGHYDWFFGSGIHLKQAREELKEQLLGILRSFPTDRSGFIAVLEGKKPVYLSRIAKAYIDQEMIYRFSHDANQTAPWIDLEGQHVMLYSKLFEPFGWRLVYGFDRSRFDANLLENQNRLERRIDQEMLRIIFGTIVIGVISVILSLFFSRNVTGIFLRYQEELRKGENRLRQLNASLEERVRDEVRQHQEKEKMLIQQSKMAEMGDMISMIAHQWRQPLNQLSYVFMNIEGAFEYKELTQKYLDEKLGEGTRLLEFMSHTIDDFRNFFRPDKARSEVTLSDMVSQTLPLIEKTLEVHGIALHVSYESHSSVTIFRNELIQVLLNLIKNAKDVLVERDVAIPVIALRTFETEHSVSIEVCDNAGGVDEKIAKKIFDPYFSTKSQAHGTGLGLYMSKTIVEGHLGGTLELKNSETGACFSVNIPR